MIKKIDITNGYGETLSLDLFQPELSGFAVREISGLGPVQATVSMADYASKPGGKFQGSRLGTREISFDLVFLDSLASIEEVRHQSYQYFPIGEKIDITITTDERTVTTSGYVENNEPEIWAEDFEGCTIDVVCESPFLKGKDMFIKNLASSYKSFHFPFSSLKQPELLFGYIKVGTDLEITNDGEQECGCIFNIIALEDFSNPLIYNDLDGTYFGLMINVDEGDTVVINTKVGEKSVKLIRNGQEYNVINYLKPESTWFQLKRGKNQFSIGHADTYTKSISAQSAIINADAKPYNLNEVRLTSVLTQPKAGKQTAKNPKEIKIPTGFNVTANKTYWSNEDTDTEKYPVDSKSVTFSASLTDIFNNLVEIRNDEVVKVTNQVANCFGAGYIQLVHETEKNNEDDPSPDDDLLAGYPKLVMTHVRIPYYYCDWDTNARFSGNPIFTYSNTYNKDVKYTYAKMKFQSCYWSGSSSFDRRSVINADDLKPNTPIYSNRFVYHPEFNTAATTKELSYYFPDMKGQSNCVSYWDNKGKLVLVEFIKGNYTDVWGKVVVKKGGKKVKIKKKTRSQEKNSPGYKHWDSASAKKWLKANKTYFIAELKYPREFYIDEEFGNTNPDTTSALEDLIYDIFNEYAYAIDDKITLTMSPYDTDTVTANAEINYTKTVGSRYEYYNGLEMASLTFNNCYAESLLYLRCHIPYSSTAYPADFSFNITVNDIVTTIDFGENYDPTEDPFYGGYIDITNGTMTYLYNPDGSESDDPDIVDDFMDPTEINFEEGENIITTSVGTIDRLIYPIFDGTTLDRMNLKIEHDNYYVGI
ncbi:MAG: phage tail family protein [Pseudobutyrivibrio sp.]|nr:phage tail family protein [Pseudobutyrivibrio sp.]